MNRSILSLLVALLFGLMVLPPSELYAVEVTVKRDLIYARYGERTLELDLYLPESQGDSSAAIVLVHGGGWIQGSREKFSNLARALSERGYVVANMSYRLATEAKFPGAVSDVKAATRWLRHHADKYNVDPNRIAGIGGSAGGHLVAMAGLTPGSFEGNGGLPDVSSEMSAIVVMGSGVDQVARIRESKSGEIKNCTVFFGGTIEEVPEVYHQASPITHVSAETPPILFLDGSLDRPGERYFEMREKLDECGVTHQLSVVDGAKHGQWGHPEFRTKFVEAMTKFLNETLP